MALNFKRLKQINDNEKFAVFGYIRETENKLSLLNIPIMIYYLCLAYYFQQDYFEKRSKNMAISADKLTVTDNGEATAAYSCCKQWIDSHVDQITKWIIKINHLGKAKHEVCMRFCIISQKRPHSPRLRYPVCGLYYFDKKHVTLGVNGPVMYTNDIISIVLNTKKRTIGVIENVEEIDIVFREIEVDPTLKYQLYVASHADKNSVSLIHFSSDLID